MLTRIGARGGLGWTGLIRATVDGPEGRTEQEFYNLITDAGLNFLRDVLEGSVANGKIQYIAVGTSNTAVANGQTALGGEIYRKPVVTTPTTVGQVSTSVVFEPEDVVGAIREIGWFAGPTATATPGSGVMIARVLYTLNKTNLQTLFLERLDTIGRV